MGEGDFDGSLGAFVRDDDSGAESGGEALLAVRVEGRPEGGDVAGFVRDGFDRQVADGQRGGFAFELRKFGTDLAEAVVKRRVDFLELLHADASGDVEVVHLLHFRTHADHSFQKNQGCGHPARPGAAARYAWADNPVANLFSNEGLPVTPFRTDDFERTTKPKPPVAPAPAVKK